MRDAEDRLHRAVSAVVEGLGYELVGIERRQGRGAGLVRVFIDKEAGITLEDCERVSHQLSGVLDVEDLIRGAYTLEVSSPGLDRPLFTPAQFERNVGATVRLGLTRSLDGRRKLVGRLEGVQDGEVVIAGESGTYRVPFDLIEKARLVPE